MINKNEISIRCSASNKKGFGNFNRCLTLAEGLRKKKYKISFIIDDHQPIIRELIKRKFQYKIISKFSPDLEYATILSIFCFFMYSMHSAFPIAPEHPKIATFRFVII